MNEILETIGVAVVRISHLEQQLAAQAAEIVRLQAENAALREWLRGECSIVDVDIDAVLARNAGR